MVTAPTPLPAPLSPGRVASLLLAHLEAGGSGAVVVRGGPDGVADPGGETGPAPRLLVLTGGGSGDGDRPEPPGPAGGPPVESGARGPGAGGPLVRGSLGDPELDEAARALALRLLTLPGEGRDPLHRLPLEGRDPVPVYVEVHHPPATLVIVGAGHIARPLAEVGTLLGFRVTVLDDRPAFATRERFPSAADVRVVDFGDPFAGVPVNRGTHVVLVTRGHRYDYECLLRLLRLPDMPGYLGLIGSRRRIRATFAQLVGEEGIPRDRLAAVRAPLGLDLGAQTPAEIAVAVAAELILLHRGGSGAPLRERERVLERHFPAGGEE